MTPVAISVGISPMLDRVVLDIEGQAPFGITEDDALTLATHLQDAVQQMRDARKARPQ
jgi:hypothetical protein